MTPQQIRLVQETWQSVWPIRQQAATIFYQKLFAAAPQLRALFKSDLEEQKVKLMNMIGVAVRGLGRPDELLPAVRELGQRHHAYGVKDADYSAVGTALLATLEAGLGPAFTAEVNEAWTAVYAVLASTMQQAAQSAAA